MIEKINFLNGLSVYRNNFKQQENKTTSKYQGLPNNLIKPSGNLLHSYMVSFGSTSINKRWDEVKTAMTPKAQEVYKDSQKLAKKYNHAEVKQIHVLRVFTDKFIDIIDKMDNGDLSAINDNLFTAPMSLKDRFGEKIFEDEKKRKILKELLVEENKILDEKLRKMPKAKTEIKMPKIAKDYVNDIYNPAKSDSAADEMSSSDELLSVTDRYFLNSAIWPSDEKIDKELSEPFLSSLSKGLMTYQSDSKIPLKFFDGNAKKVWENLAVGTNMFITYEKNQKSDYILDSFEKVLQESDKGFGKFNKDNTEVNRYNDSVNIDFMIDEIKRGIKDKSKKHVYVFEYDSLCSNESGEGICAVEQYIKELHKYPNLRFVITAKKDDYYDSILKKDDVYKDFSKMSIPIINMEQAKKMFKDEKALIANIKKEFSQKALDKTIEATNNLDGYYPEKAQKVMNLMSTYYFDKKIIHAQDVTNYINEAKEVFKANDKDKSSVQIILNTGIKLKDIIGLKSTQKEAASIVRQIKDHSIGTKGYILYSQDGMPGAGRNYTARAIAGEAKIPFLEINAVDFGTKDVNLFGESSTTPEEAMKELFSRAKSQAETNPHKGLVLYIQNFEYFSCGDQVSEYHEKAMSQLLREMDNAQKQGLNIAVMGSVGNPDLIGESTMKSFKFVDKIEVESPSRNQNARKELIDHYLKEKKVKLDAKTPEEKEGLLDQFATMTEYFPLLKIMTLIDKVKNVSKERGNKATNKADFIEAFMQLECGRPASYEMKQFSKDIVTSHECGHAINHTIMNEITKSIKPWAECEPVTFITLDPRSDYLGAVYSNGTGNMEFTFEQVFSNIVASFGGHSCEKHLYGMDGSWGITADMAMATEQATQAIAIMGQGYNFGKKSLDGAAFADEYDKATINKDLKIFLKNAETVSHLITEEYSDFIKLFTKKYASKVGTGECIIPGDKFTKELNEWRSKLPKSKQEDLMALNELIKDVMYATQKGIIYEDNSQNSGNKSKVIVLE